VSCRGVEPEMEDREWRRARSLGVSCRCGKSSTVAETPQSSDPAVDFLNSGEFSYLRIVAAPRRTGEFL
jgi:hypothetical protein